MKRILWIAAQVVAMVVVMWVTGWLFSWLGTTRSTAGMILLLEVLAIATRGDWILALLSSTAASLVFSVYFIEQPRNVRFTTTMQGVVSFAALALTAFIGSRLAVRAQQRAREAIARREEMEHLNQLGRVLLAANSLSAAAHDVVRKLVELFHLDGAILRLAGQPQAFQWGVTVPGEVSIIPLGTDHGADVLELHGVQPSEEVRNTIASMIRLVLERARGEEERAQIEIVRRGEELRTTVLNSLAHNFRTPLTSIKAAASTLRLSGRVPSIQERDLVVVIDEEADRLNQLIRESLDMAKLEARRANPLTEECSIPGIVRRAASRMSRYLSRREFIIDIPEDLPPVMGDSFLLEQMLGQLLDNAWKYSQPGAPVKISASAGEASIILTVWNQGVEIPEEDREKIFERFYRGSRDRHRVEGTGMGLAIARTIAEACGGKIWLDAEPMGPAFRLQLPMEAPGVAAGRQRDREQHYIAH